MKRFLLLVIALFAFTNAPQSAFAYKSCKQWQCESQHWWVEIAGNGNCYARYKADGDRRTRSRGPYFSAMLAYIAIARNPACYRTTEWLMNYEYIRRAVR